MHPGNVIETERSGPLNGRHPAETKKELCFSGKVVAGGGGTMRLNRTEFASGKGVGKAKKALGDERPGRSIDGGRTFEQRGGGASSAARQLT